MSTLLFSVLQPEPREPESAEAGSATCCCRLKTQCRGTHCPGSRTSKVKAPTANPPCGLHETCSWDNAPQTSVPSRRPLAASFYATSFEEDPEARGCCIRTSVGERLSALDQASILLVMQAAGGIAPCPYFTVNAVLKRRRFCPRLDLPFQVSR